MDVCCAASKGVQPEKEHLPHAPNLEEKCMPTTSHKACLSDTVKASKGVQPEKMHPSHASSLEEGVCLSLLQKSAQVTWYKQVKRCPAQKAVVQIAASRIVKGRAIVMTGAKVPPTGCQLESTQLAQGRSLHL